MPPEAAQTGLYKNLVEEYGLTMEQKVQSDIIRTVGSLLPEQFFVPKYQRGYRWTKQQVTDLLEDINDFEPITYENQSKSWYCLQPLVVRRKGDKWNLIDGQQRLTTIYLILHFLRENLGERGKQKLRLYSLEYETRKAGWLGVLSNEEKATENIDFWYIHTAYQTISGWFSKNENENESKFLGKLSEDCKFIWYDIDQTGNMVASEEEVFIRLNIGKILLTNAELIKALFLNRSNFTSNSKDSSKDKEVRLRQLEIATQWDVMEEELANDAFWYFINGKENNIQPRINYLFDILSGIIAPESDAYATFRYFQERFDNKMLAANPDIDKETEDILVVDREWELIYKNYQVLREWFKDHSYHHFIGYLLTCNESLKSLLDEYFAKTKFDFKKTLTDKIRRIINWNGKEDIYKSDQRCRKILLLHNVITMQQLENDNLRFPFHKYHTEKWDIEHIQAVADPEKKPKTNKDRKQYLEDSGEFVNDAGLKSEIDSFLREDEKLKDDAEFDTLYGKIIKHFSENDVESAETDTLSNLALLDSSTNRGYGNAVFPAKRKTILDKDASGKFIPICTKYAFLKYYTRKDFGDLNRWNQKDRIEYLYDINGSDESKEYKGKLFPYFQKGDEQ